MKRPASMRILGPDGVTDVLIIHDEEASRVGRFWNAVQRFLARGDEDALRPFANQKVAGVPLETDPDLIELWARRGELDIEDIYEN